MTSEPLGVGIVGLGRAFMLTLPALLGHASIRIAGAMDPRPEARARFENEFRTRSYETLEGLLGDLAVEAVYIASPHAFHAEQTIAALEAGRHVLVEKPMATTLADCIAMADAADRTGRILMVGPSHGFDAPVRLAADLIARGDLGTVRLVTALNYTDFLYRPRRPEELDSQQGGGVVYSQATHHIDVVRRLVARDLRSVRAFTGDWDPERSTEGAYSALVTFSGGAAASIGYSGYGRYDSDELMDWVSELGQRKNPESYGAARSRLTEGTSEPEVFLKLERAYGALGINDQPDPAAFHEHFGFVLVSCEEADLRLTADGVWVYGNSSRIFHALPPPDMPRSAPIEDLVQAVRFGRTPVHDGRWGAQTVACCDALLRSSREQREIFLSLSGRDQNQTLSKGVTQCRD